MTGSKEVNPANAESDANRSAGAPLKSGDPDPDPDPGTIEVSLAQEGLRQQQEAFNQVKKHDSLWFAMRLTMGWLAVGVIIVVVFVCSYIILNAADFDRVVVTLAAAALLVDVLATMLAIWKIVLGPAQQDLAPFALAQGVDPHQ